MPTYRKGLSPNVRTLSRGLQSGIVLLMLLLALIGCKPNRNAQLAERVYEVEGGDNPSAEPEKIQEIKKELNRWEKELNDAITAGRNTGRFYRTLGMKYLDYKMYGPARDSFSRSLEFSPENGRLYYYRGVAISRLALTRSDETERLKELNEAEQDYLRAIKIEPNFTPPYYSLSILYIFELDRAFEAEKYLEKYVSIERSDSKGHMLYAQLLEDMGQFEQAMDQYNKVLSLPGSEVEKEQARQYIQRIKEEWQ
jgi:tetratricopeptide (TPR) repeat protein